MYRYLLISIVIISTCYQRFIPAAEPAISPSFPPLRQMIGQLLIVGFHGINTREPDVQNTLRYLKSGELGGVIFHRYNLQSAAQIKKLNQAFAAAASNPVFFAAISQEGGQVQRITPPIIQRNYPAARELAMFADEQQINTSRIMADELKTLGFNLNFSPVVDLHSDHSKNIGALERAFSEDPEKVTQSAANLIRGHHQTGLLTALKHFPGNGLAHDDSQQGQVDVTKIADAKEQIPYRRLIKNHLVDMIMTAHTFNRHVDEKYPASLSRRTIQGLLRNQIGYKGVVITSDLHMGAILQHYSIEQAIVLALAAGADMVLLSNNPGASEAVVDFKPDSQWPKYFVDTVEAAIQNGELPLERIHEAYLRVIALSKNGRTHQAETFN